MYIDTSGNDPSLWGVDKIYFAGKLWSNTGAILKAWRARPGKDVTDSVTPALTNGTTAYRFNGVTFYTPGEVDEAYSSNTVRGSPLRPSVPRRGPVEYEPQGKRYNISGGHISWMGWDLDVSAQKQGDVAYDYNGLRAAPYYVSGRDVVRMLEPRHY